MGEGEAEAEGCTGVKVVDWCHYDGFRMQAAILSWQLSNGSAIMLT